MKHSQPLVPSSKFPVNPLLPEIKWRHPGENRFRCALHFILFSYSQNGYSKDFLMYDCVPGEFL